MTAPSEQIERGLHLAKECASKNATPANWHALRAHLERMTQTLPCGNWADARDAERVPYVPIDLRAKFGRPCLLCQKSRPKAHPSILLPGQVCRLDNFRDPRPRITDDERSGAPLTPHT